MKRTPIRMESEHMRKVERPLRKRVRALLLKTQPRIGDIVLCAHCGQRPDWRGLQMHHKVHLSRGGKTSVENCELWCAPCHMNSHGLREV